MKFVMKNGRFKAKNKCFNSIKRAELNLQVKNVRLN